MAEQQRNIWDLIAKHSVAFSIGFLCLLCAALYLNTLHNDFVLDDNSYIVDNYLLRDPGNVWKFIDVPDNALVEDLEAGFLRGRNVRWLTYSLDYAIGGGDPLIFHLSNLLWHVLVTVALFFAAWRIFQNIGGGLLTASLFAAHPIQTAAVSYISGRKDLLAAFFTLLAFLLLEKFRNSGRYAYLIGTILAFAVGYFSKESAVVLPLLVVWSDWCRSERLNLSTLAALARKYRWQYLLLFGMAAFFAIRAIGLAPFLQLLMPAHAPASQAANAAASLAQIVQENRSYANLMIFYGMKLLWPFHLLADYRGVFEFSLYPARWGQWLSPVFVVLCLVGAWLLHRRKPIMALGFGWIWLALLPVSHLIPFHYPVAEHYLYLPAAGFCLMVAGLNRQQSSSLARWLPWGLLLLVMAATTVARNRDWQNMETVTLDILRKAPRHQGARNTLVHLLIEKGELRQALIEGELAVRQDPNSPINHYNLGVINDDLGNFEAARIHYYRALELQPRLWDAYLNLGNLLLMQGRIEEGTAVLQRLTNLYGYHPLAYWVLGNQRAREGDWAAARELYRREVSLDQHDGAGYLGLAGAAWHLGDDSWRDTLRMAVDKGLSIEWAREQEPWKSFLQESQIRQYLATINTTGAQ